MRWESWFTLLAQLHALAWGSVCLLEGHLFLIVTEVLRGLAGVLRSRECSPKIGTLP